MSRPLSHRIVAGALVSVIAAGALLVVGLKITQPAVRAMQMRLLMVAANVDACVTEPTTWGIDSDDLSMHAYDVSGRSANANAPPLEPALLRDLLDSSRVGHVVTSHPLSVAAVTLRSSGPCAIIRMNSSTADRIIARRFFTVVLLILLVGMLFAALVMWWFVVRPLRARAGALSRAASDVGAEGFVALEHRSDALGHVAGVLSNSHHRIVAGRKALQERNVALEQHLAGIAHDLRTPMASMQLALESMASEANVGLRQEARRALTDVVYLSSLVENLHHGTRLRYDVDVPAGRVELAQLVSRLEGRFSILGRHAAIDVAVSVPERGVWASCSPSLAERAISNLIQNAIEHRTGPGHVAVLLTTGDNAAAFALEVVDDGPGLPNSVIASLEEESFLRDPARGRGPGLGMMITAEVARRAGWTLTYEAIKPHGLRARLAGPTVVAPEADVVEPTLNSAQAESYSKNCKKND